MTWTRPSLIAAFAVAAVAVIAAIVSFGHIEALALAQHQSLASARLLPFTVDGMIVAGSVIVLAGSALGWISVVPGIAATLFANIMSAAGHGWLAGLVAAWPAVAFTVASFVLERWLARPVAVPDAEPAVASVALSEPPAEPAVASVASQEPEESQDESPEAQARAAWLSSLASGKPLTDRALGMAFGKSRTWGASRIREAQAEAA